MKIATTIATPHASRYLQQLCKHFGHKIETRYDAHSGTCRFPHSTVELHAHDDGLDISVTAADEDGLSSGCRVVWSHLARFAFREDLPEPHWTPPAA